MHAGSVKGMDSCVDTWNTLKATLQYNYSQAIFFPPVMHFKSTSKASVAELKSHSWLAIKLCASMMTIMLGNNGCNACQRGNTDNIKGSSSSSLQPAQSTRMEDKVAGLFLLQAYQISNLVCSV